MEKYRFFDAVEDENGVYDREYNAQEFTDYFKALVTTGLMKGAGNELAVTTNGSSMITSIDTGIAFILGRYYENDSPLELTHDTEVLSKSRIDRIVIRMDLSTEARYVKAFIKKGVASTNPVAPALTQTPNLYEISLAQVKIVGGQTYISVDDITDERGTEVICPWAGSNILPNFNDAALQDLINKVDNMFSLTDGSNTKILDDSVNLDDVLESGFYTNNGATSTLRNYPETRSAPRKVLLEVFVNSNPDWIIQRYTYKDNTGLNMFVRSKTLNWTPWLKIANEKQENWIDITLTMGTPDTTNKPQYYKDDFGVVHVAGKVKGTTMGWQMPVGYKPQKSFIVPLLQGTAVRGFLSVQTNGYFVASLSTDTYYEFYFSYRAGDH